MLKVSQAAFAVAWFWGLSDVLECLGCLQMAAQEKNSLSIIVNKHGNEVIPMLKTHKWKDQTNLIIGNS